MGHTRMKTPVGHLKRRYGGLTETFIYAYLSNAQRVRPFVLTDVACNQTSFPMACSYLLEAHEMEALERRMGAQFAPFVQAFFREMDYPNCFERLIREKGIELLHAHFGDAGRRSLRLKRKLGIPLVTTFYGIDASKWLWAPEMREAHRRLFREGDLFLVLGEDMARRLRAAGCPAERMRVQHLGIDVERIACRPRTWPGHGGGIVLLYCGRLVKKKGIRYALEAFAQLAGKWKALEFRIVGEGPLRPAVERAVRRMNLQDRVALRGALSHSETLCEMQDAHLFILPSVTAPDGDMEGTPTVLLEAQASGLPVVSTYHADIPEVVVTGQTGFLVPEYDAQALADRLDYLLEHPDVWADMGQAGRRHVERHYNIHREVAKLEAIYRDLIGI